MGAIVAFFTHLTRDTKNLKASPTKTRDAHVINIANLNYCGIMKSPFEFYSGKNQQVLQELSHNFDIIRKTHLMWD